MINKPNKIKSYRKVTAKQFNDAVTGIKNAKRLNLRGGGGAARASVGPVGTNLRLPITHPMYKCYIAEIDSNATGGGYYNCHLQKLDATDWDSTTADQLDDTGDSVVVLNLDEIGTAKHELVADQHMLCWKFTDDEGTVRYVGSPGSGGRVFRAITQEAAQADAYISVKLTTPAGAATGSAFDATCIFSDAATAANACSPLIATAKTILITLVDGTWYIVNPTLAEMGTSTSTVSSAATTIFGRTMYQIGEW